MAKIYSNDTDRLVGLVRENGRRFTRTEISVVGS